MIEQKLSVSEALNQLGLSAMPLAHSYGHLEEFLCPSGELPLYFDGTIEEVTEADHEYEAIYSSIEGKETDVTDLLIANRTVDTISGRIHLCSPHFIKRNDSYEITDHKFIYAGKKYYSCDQTGMFVRHMRFDLDSVYVLKADLHQLVEGKSHTGRELGLRKALALLAQEKAQSSPKFRAGNKVNASAFKDHLLELANKYGLTQGHLKTLDDKLNGILNELELKEILRLEQREK